MREAVDWMVIGAGPAGIAAVGKLIDAGIDPAKIGWIDPHFQVGDFGKKWSRVPSNTKVSLFLRFIENCKSFDFQARPSKFHLETLNPEENCYLRDAVEPLQWITDQLKKKVRAAEDLAVGLNISQKRWEIKTKQGVFFSKNVILAIGSDTKTLSHPAQETILLETALDEEKLAKAIKTNDTVAVFGSSHSAILVLANLIRLKPKQVFNFYRSPHRYAVYLDNWILYDDTGLKGFTAEWAKTHLDGAHPQNLKRVLVSEPAFEESLAFCNKAVYAVGFERRKIPVLEQFKGLHYDDKTGIIAPGLFGIGIAFPQSKMNPLGQLEFRVGLWKFMDYLNTILPIWLKYRN